ncbi:hypothetical protein [Nocardioides ultimimeridianus]
MIRWAKRRFVARRDEGAILVFALIVVTAVALVVGTILTRGQGSLMATVSLRSAAASPYAADAAANVVLNDLRTGTWLGSAAKTSPTWGYDNNAFDGCFGRDAVGVSGDTTPVSTVTLSNVYPASGSQTTPTSAYVVCTPENATGEQGTPVAINNSNKPGNAILTLGTSSGETGFTFKTNGSGGAFRVKGGVWSNSTIAQSQNGNLESTTYIRAHSGCSPLSAMSAPIVDCGAATVTDPGLLAQTATQYQNDITHDGLAFPTLQTVPANCNSGTVTLSQGYYDDVTNLNALTSAGGGNCFIHFNPGDYYFDFHNNSADPLFQSAIAPNTGDVWNINSGTVVGGTLTTDTTIPGRCVSPIDSAVQNQGVQFIMGGDSRISVDKGAQVELCGNYHPDRPPIAVYGQSTGSNPSLTTPSAITISNASPAPTVSPANSWIHGTTGSAAPTAADIVTNGDGNVTTFKRSGGTSTATITESGFTPGTNIPAGAILTGMSVKVGYSETNGSAASLVVTPKSSAGTGSAINGFTLPGTTPATQPYLADLPTISAGNFGTLQKYVHDNGLTGMSIGFAAGPKNNGDTTTLDSLNTVTLKYYVPQIRGETTTTIPSNTVATVGGSPVVQAQGNTTVFYTQGTTYVPQASMYLSLNNISESVFRFGVIARSLQVFETGSFAFTGPVIELPDDSPGWGTQSTLVQLKVYLCPGSSTCSDTTGTKALTVRAQIWDPTAVVNPPAREVNILSWSRSS